MYQRTPATGAGGFLLPPPAAMALPEIHCTQDCRFEEATPMKISHQRVLDHKIFHNFSTPINPNFPVPYWELVGYSGCFRSEERRVGQEGVGNCRFRRSPYK